MRMTALSAVFGLLIVAACAVGAKAGREPVPGAPPAPERGADGSGDAAIKQMIEDLGSDDWRTREKAGRDLAAKGEQALPQMRAVLLSTDSPEVQRRLSVLVRKLDRERLVEPKRVTASVKNKAPKDVFEEIAKQTGYKIEFGGGGPDTKYSFEFKNVPFWQAVDTVANASGYSVFAEYDDETIRVFNQDTMNPFVAYAGPFRFLATNIQSSRSVQLSGLSRRNGNNQNMNEYINLSFQIQSEPKNPMLGVLPPELTEAKDDLGGSLLPIPDRNNFRTSFYNGGFRGHNTYMNVNLNRSDRAATSIKVLKGRVGVVLLSGTAPEVIVLDPLKVKKKSFVGRTAELEVAAVDEDATQKGNYLVTVSAKKLTASDPNRNEDWTWSQTVWQRLELTDEKGNKYACSGPQSFNPNNGGGAVQMVLLFTPNDRRTGRPNPNKLGPPKKLVLNEWLSITHEVTFEFKDIPLP